VTGPANRTLMDSERSPSGAPLETRALCRSYGRLVALAGLDLTVEAGECVALIGANGSGKSTAVRTIAGLLEPGDGSVRVCGFDPHREPEAEQARAALALVPDSPLLYDDLTVRQHLELVSLAHGAVDAQADSRITLLLARLGLTAREDFLPRELSRGMRLVLDEPVVGLDPPAQALLYELLRERKRAGNAVLVTTHQIAFVDGLADRGVVLDEGAVVDEGPWAQVRERAQARGWR